MCHHSFLSASVGFARIVTRAKFVGRHDRSVAQRPNTLAQCLAIASESSRRLTSTPTPAPPHKGEGKVDPPRSGEGFMTAVAHWLVLGALAGAEPHLFVRCRLPFLRPEFGALVRAVAERLRLRAPAGAPPVAFAGHDIDREAAAVRRFQVRSFLLLRSAHVPLPPPSVASHASPHALASSRTRRM